MAAPKRINLTRAAAWGATLAPLLLAAQMLLTGETPPSGIEWVGFIIGGAIGGAFIFLLAGAAMNAVRK